ncbi:response regulator transcription factor [Polynucleobacter sp. 31A-FELB]|uniref:response regulator transcription factor n=1 Tax=Polynucleobacter sp. 31A-FELB TaxID=2689096 RepID=UPI001C0B0B96|nr:response regulator [Polynucleobacter sp. 31A-FELB]MBU3587204.1 response regulator transcription factor [Polynucleobacter sp. 31A-FELB]
MRQATSNPTNTKPSIQSGVVYVIDDDEAIRDSLSLLLNANGFRVSPHESAERFLKSLASSDPQSLSCALVDIHLGGMSGIELQETLLNTGLNIPICFITGQAEIHSAVTAFKKGAFDFIQKPVDEEKLCGLINEMLSKAYLSKEQSSELKEIKERFRLLTQREVDVLDRIVAGRINKEVGMDLGISIKTVEAHRANLMEKLKVNRAAKLLQLTLRYREAKAKGLV